MAPESDQRRHRAPGVNFTDMDAGVAKLYKEVMNGALGGASVRP
jgi:hypothetical protein